MPRILLAVFCALLLACGGAGTRNPTPQASAPHKPGGAKFAKLIRELHATQNDIARGITRAELQAHVKRLIAESDALRSLLSTDTEVAVSNKLVDAVDAYQTSVAIWEAQEATARAAEHSKRYKVTLNFTPDQLAALHAGKVIVRVNTDLMKWDHTAALGRFGVPFEDLGSAAFAPADARETLWVYAAGATRAAVGMTE